MLADSDGKPLSIQNSLKIENDANDKNRVRVIAEFIFPIDEFEIEDLEKEQDDIHSPW